jgi:hypothetical protein
MAFRFDIPCLCAAALFSLSHVLSLFVVVHRGSGGGGRHFDVAAWKALDATFIQAEQAYQRQIWALEVTTGILNALGWIVFAIPLIHLAWLLSSGGRRQLSTRKCCDTDIMAHKSGQTKDSSNDSSPTHDITFFPLQIFQLRYSPWAAHSWKYAPAS